MSGKKKRRGDLYNRNYIYIGAYERLGLHTLRGIAVSLTTIEENMA